MMMKKHVGPLTLLLAFAIAAPAFAQSADEQLAAAGALYDARKYQEAAQRLDQFLAGTPPPAKVGVAAFTLGRCYSELRQWEKAVPAYEKAVTAMDPAVTANAQLGLCEAAMQSSQWEKAAAAL